MGYACGAPDLPWRSATVLGPEGLTRSQASCQSLLGGLADLNERNTWLTWRITQLERRLSETRGQDAWRASGLGAPGDIDVL
ncbi:hypothetical protein [Streptomyces sp. NPDC048612]|uniref:hypothetical protein n=1 Tax=Streptomyces sp. NPDC048612 TaxID=3365579 RepID=UPI003711EF14